MKRIFIYTLLVIFAGAGCRKNDNPKLPDFTRVPLPSITKDATANVVISALAPNTFNGKFVVDLFFKSDVKPSKLDIVVIKNGDNAGVKIIQAGVTSYPASIPITGQQLATLFGTPVVLGDKFDIGADVYTQDNQKYPAFPVVGIGYGTNVGTEYNGLTTSVRYEAVCVFNAADYAGNFKVTVDAWNDFSVGTIIPISVVGPSKLSFISPVNGKAIIIDVNTVTNITSVASQSYGDYKAAGLDPTWTFGNSNVASNNTNANNFVAPCDGVLSLALDYIVSAGTLGGGPYILKMKKQ